MKRSLTLIIALVLVNLLAARAQGPDDQYLAILNTIQEADSLQSQGQSNQALAKYLEAQSALQRFQKGYREWNAQVVKFRLSQVESKIGSLSVKAPAPVPPVASGAVSVPAKPTRDAPAIFTQAAKPSLPSESESQLMAFNEQMRQLQAEKTLLEAKLKEALAAQPASLDPREMAKAEEKIKSLQKETDLLKVSLNQTKSKAPAIPDGNTKALEEARQALAATNLKLEEQTKKVNALVVEKNAMQNALNSTISSNRNSASTQASVKALEEANRRLAEQKQLAARIELEKDALQERLKLSSSETGKVAVVRSENELLKKQLADLKSTKPAASKASEPLRQLGEAKTQIAALETDKEMLRLERIALETRVKQLSATGATATATSASKPAAPPAKALIPAQSNNGPIKAAIPNEAERARIRELERERAELQAKLETAVKSANARKGKGADKRIDDMENQMAALRARLEVFEARAVPYTAEELALLKKPETKLAAANPTDGKALLKNLPPGSAPLVAEAQRYFLDKRLDKAEEKYLELLSRDEKNVYTLANLTAIQLELGHLKEAEKHINHAVKLAPDDAYSLTMLGYLKYKQQKFDEAVDALSQAAKLEPENPEIQNYLGLALSQKGLRGPAETALRRAIQINPSYGSAHNNLAVIYLAQQPPSVELARWHYQKAMASGHPRNAALEKLLDTRKIAEVRP